MKENVRMELFGFMGALLMALGWIIMVTVLFINGSVLHIVVSAIGLLSFLHSGMFFTRVPELSKLSLVSPESVVLDNMEKEIDQSPQRKSLGWWIALVNSLVSLAIVGVCVYIIYTMAHQPAESESDFWILAFCGFIVPPVLFLIGFVRVTLAWKR